MPPLLQEIGGFRKRRADLRIALVYPNSYRVGMANLGLHTVYSLFNSYPDVACERCFLGMDRSIETNTPLSDFDVIAFSLQYELDYPNVYRILREAGIEVRRDRRASPMVIAGGPCCFNPIPMTDVVDLFAVGDVEPVADNLIRGLLLGESAVEIAQPEGLLSSESMDETQVARAEDLDAIPAPINQPRPVSGMDHALGDTFMVEISRGCNVRCRFCMYSHCTFPKRERSFDRIREIVEEGIRVTGSSKVSLIGALVTDHSELKGILGYLADRGLSASLPSIRTDGVDEEVLELIGELGIRTLTIAPEGSPHIRSILKKGLQEDGIRYVGESAHDHGVRKLRLYFMTGIPGEQESDLQYVTDLCSSFAKVYGPRGLTASVNPLIPKPHTPAESIPMANPERIEANYAYLRRNMPRGMNLNLQSVRMSVIQAYLARGTRKTAAVLAQMGESSGYGVWKRAAASSGDPITRAFCPPREMPWHVIKTGLPRDYLQRQSDRMLNLSGQGPALLKKGGDPPKKGEFS